MPKGKNKTSFLTKPLNRKRYRRERKAAERLQFGPQKRQLKAEKRESREQERRVGGYFDQYRAQLAALQQGQQDAYNAAYGKVAQATGLNQDAGIRDRLRAEEERDAQVRGTTASATPYAEAAELSRQRLASGAAATVATQGARQSAYLADKQRIGAREGVEQQLKEAERRRAINQDQRSLAKERGDFRTTFRTEAREGERRYELANKELKRGSKNVRLQGKENRKGQRLGFEQDKALARQDARLNPPASGKTPAQKKAAKRDFKNAYQTAKSLLDAAKKPPRTKEEWAAFARLVEKEAEGVDLVTARKAIARLKKKQKPSAPDLDLF